MRATESQTAARSGRDGSRWRQADMRRKRCALFARCHRHRFQVPCACLLRHPAPVEKCRQASSLHRAGTCVRIYMSSVITGISASSNTVRCKEQHKSIRPTSKCQNHRVQTPICKPRTRLIDAVERISCQSMSTWFPTNVGGIRSVCTTNSTFHT